MPPASASNPGSARAAFRPPTVQPSMPPPPRLKTVKPGAPPPAPPPTVSIRRFLVDIFVTALCPCVPLAQVASSTDLSYGLVLGASGLLYLGGGLFFGLASQVQRTFLSAKSLVAILLMKHLTFLWGPFTTALVMIYQFATARHPEGAGQWITSGSESATSSTWSTAAPMQFSVSPLAIALVSLAVLTDLALAIGLLLLRRRLQRHDYVGKTIAGETVLLVACCAFCSLVEMICAVKDATSAMPLDFGPLDVLPGYDDGGDGERSTVETSKA